MKNTYSYIILLSLFTILTAGGCKKEQASCTDPVCKLPPATQTGANTFGCLVNGQAWIPNDNYGQATFKLEADPTFQDGVFGIAAIQYFSSGKFQMISVGSDSCGAAGVYSFLFPRNRAQFSDVGKLMDLQSGDLGTFCNGNLTITRYDLINRIFSGTFEFTIGKAGSDTFKITNGRFDKKL